MRYFLGFYVYETERQSKVNLSIQYFIIIVNDLMNLFMDFLLFSSLIEIIRQLKELRFVFIVFNFHKNSMIFLFKSVFKLLIVCSIFRLYVDILTIFVF